MPYSEEKYAQNKERILTALDALFEIQKTYKDVIAITDVVSLHDIMEYRLQTEHGIQKFCDVFDAQDAEFVLRKFSHRSFVTPETFEDTIVSALQIVSKINQTNKD